MNPWYLPSAAIGFAVGVSLGLADRTLGLWASVPLALVAVTLVWGARTRASALMVLAIAGLASGMARASVPLAPSPAPSEGRWIVEVVEGQRPASRTGRWQADLVAHERAGEFVAATGRVRVSGHAVPWLLQPGERVMLRASLRAPREPAHSLAWDSSSALRRAGLVGELRALAEPVVLDARWRARTPVERARVRVERAVITSVPAREAGVLLALLTGTRSEIDAADRDRFSRSGAAHVLAVSGLHLGLLILAFFRATRWLLRQWVLRARWPGPDALAAWITLPVLLAYVCFTGWPASACRAGLMASVMLLGVAVERAPSSIHALSVSALLLLAWRPLWLLDLGFQLSVTATASLIAAGAARRAWSTPAVGRLAQGIEGLRASVVATLATGPSLLWVLGSVPLMSPIANLLVVPPLALVALPFGVVGSALVSAGLPFGDVVLEIARVSVTFALWVAEAGERPLTLTLWWGRPNAWSMFGWTVLAFASPALFVARRSWHVGVALLVLPCLWLGAPRWWRSAEAPTVHAVATSLERTLLVESAEGATLVVDPGSATALGGSSSASALRSWLAGLGYGRIDLLVVNGCDASSSGAAVEAVQQLRPRLVWLSREVAECARGERIVEAAHDAGARLETVTAVRAERLRDLVVISLPCGALAPGWGCEPNTAQRLVVVRWGTETAPVAASELQVTCCR